MKRLPTQSVLTIVGTALIVAGGVLGIGPFRRALIDQRADAETSFLPPAVRVISPEESNQVEGKPVHLSIPSLDYESGILDGTYSNAQDSWNVSGKNPHYALESPLANNISGATFIYGHNNRNVFANLYKLDEGDQAVITTRNGHTFRYAYYSHAITDPQDTSLFAYDGYPVLILQTCSGAWYEHRSLYSFRLVEAL